ncbi:MAG: ACT domain-containing protein [Clostridia bacterium]|nr:ACT domain-containing protein [Clostridia bacterium]
MIKQLAVFLENREGRVSECCKTIKNAGVNLCSMSIADTREFGILRIITDNNEKALVALKSAGFVSSMVELVGVEVPDTPGALADILIMLYDAGINIEYLYSFANANGHAQIGFKTATPEKAEDVLKSAGVKII